MSREILSSHVRERGLRSPFLWSMLGHTLLMALFLLAGDLWPAEVVVLGSGAGGGQGDPFVTVGLAAEVSGGQGLVKPSLNPRPSAPPPPAETPPPAAKTQPAKSEPEPERPPENVFEERSRKTPPKKKTTPSPAPAKKAEAAPQQAPSPGRIPLEPEKGAGGPGSPTPGSGGGLGSGSGVEVGAGAGEGVFDSWYARQVERRIGENWLRALMGEVGRPVQTRISFEIQADGRIRAIQIEQSSGVPAVDRAAERAVQASDPLPPLPYEFRNRRVKFVAHFRYPPQ